MASVGLRSGAGMLVGDGSASAKHAAEVLGTLRGLAAKVGQMASYVDGIVPEEHKEAYETALKGLRAAAPTSSPTEARAAIEEQLEAPIDRLFSRFEDAPIASASIGQVHRAWLPTGEAVAVKVQHPGIHRALESDLSNASVLGSMVGAAAGSRFKTKEQIEMVKKRFREELDYGLEAERVTMFGGFHEGDPSIRIPAVVKDRSAARVLTTDYMEGYGFEEACEKPEALRRKFAETMWRFVFKGNLVHKHFNADPHPGNYLFRDDGNVVFLDFGCVQAISDDKNRLARNVHLAALSGDERGMLDATRGLIGMKPGRLEPLALDYMRACMRPIRESPFRVTRPYAASLVEGMKLLATTARKVDESEFFDMPRDQLFMNRLQFGFYSVLARLDVEVDYAAVEREFLSV